MNSFATCKKPSFSEYTLCLKNLQRTFDQLLDDPDVLIFIDTSVYLDVYLWGIEDKEKFIKFINQYKNRLFISKTIEEEFLRNRNKVLKNKFEQYRQMKENFNKAFTIEAFYDKNKNFLDRFLDTQSSIENLIEDFSVIKNSLDLKIAKLIEEETRLIWQDPLIQALIDIESCPPLSKEEINKLQIEFNSLEKDIIKKPYPGSCEKKEGDRSGDYIIFHEIANNAKATKKGILFLTNDTKEDFFEQKITGDEKIQIFDYFVKFYLLTNQCLWVHKAKQHLKNILKSTLQGFPKSKELAMYSYSDDDDDIPDWIYEELSRCFCDNPEDVNLINSWGDPSEVEVNSIKVVKKTLASSYNIVRFEIKGDGNVSYEYDTGDEDLCLPYNYKFDFKGFIWVNIEDKNIESLEIRCEIEERED